MSDSHETPIKTPTQLITVIVLAFVVPILIITLLVNFVTSAKRTGAGSESLTAAATEARIRPVATVEVRDANAPRVLKTGAEVYKAQCSACHDAGAAGAPKLGEVAAWEPRIKTGYPALLTSALKGKGAMPAQVGGDFDELEIARAVVHMANSGGAKFSEPALVAPKANAAGTVAPAGAAPTTVATATAASAAASIATVAAATATTATIATTPAASAAPAATVAAAPAASPGKTMYDTACIACHAQGVGGAPKFGDKVAWADRVKDGLPHLVEEVIKGKGAMPPKGGRADASDADIKAAVEYMVAAVK